MRSCSQRSAYVFLVVNSLGMFKDALRSEVELELATARQKIMTIQRDIDTCERVILITYEYPLICIHSAHSGKSRPSAGKEQ